MASYTLKVKGLNPFMGDIAAAEPAIRAGDALQLFYELGDGYFAKFNATNTANDSDYAFREQKLEFTLPAQLHPTAKHRLNSALNTLKENAGASLTDASGQESNTF